MDDLDLLAAARDRSPESPKSGMRKRWTPDGDEKVRGRMHTLNSALIFIALIAFLPVPFFFFVVAGVTTPLLAFLATLVLAVSEELVGGLFAAHAVTAIYFLPCAGMTWLLMRWLRPLPAGFAFAVTLSIVVLLSTTLYMEIFGGGHNSIRYQTGLESYRELFSGGQQGIPRASKTDTTKTWLQSKYLL